MLGVLGISDEEERLYRELLDAQKATARKLASQAGMSSAAARSSLDSLEAKGLVNRSPERDALYVPVSPDIGLEILLMRRQQELDLAKREAGQLTERFKSSLHRRSPTEAVELVTGRDAIVRRFGQMQMAAREEILVFDRPPYAMDLTQGYEGGMESMRRGVIQRTLYDREALEIPGYLAQIRMEVEAGELARVMVGVPLKLLVVDHRLAMVPVAGDETGVEGAIVVHPSSLLDALVMLFEVLWDRSDPLFPDGSAHPTEHESRDSEIIGLLALGMQDQAIARHVGIAVRTVVRRVRRVMDALGAQTRFQAGAKAAERGWISRSTPQATERSD